MSKPNEIGDSVSTAFSEAYSQLNAAQKQAVDTIEGPVMVVAGPGTGKTQILTLRIANILLRTDIAASNILALTFTESGAKAMRERLRRYIGADAYRVNIFTFHGFSEFLIRSYPDAYTKVIGGRPATELEKIECIETILENTEIKILRPAGDPSYYINHILRMLGTLKQEYLTPDLFADVIAQQDTELLGIEKIHVKGAHKGKVRGEYTKKEKGIEKNRELLYIYRQYETLLKEQHLYDFEDMIVETVKALQDNEDMLRDLQETYQYLLADEHQDVNGSQNRILELLASYHESPNIFVVGDEKQAIYRFQGASLENFLYFEEKFPNTTTIALTESYRSGQMVLDASHSLIHIDEGPAAALRVPLTSAHTFSAVVEQRHFSHEVVEDAWIRTSVQTAIETGTQPQEIAVIVRTNREVEQIALLLRKHGVQVHASADGDVLSHPITHSVLSIMSAIVETRHERSLFTVLHGSYWGVSKNDLVKIVSAQRYGTTLLEIISDEQKLSEIGVHDSDAVVRVTRVLEAARSKEATDAPHRVLEFVLRESGFLDHVIATDPFEGTRVLRRVYDEIESMVTRDNLATLTDVSAAFKKSAEYKLPINAPFIATSTQAVQVMTAHKSKGLEFDTVLIPHVTDSQYGGSKKRSYFDIPLTKHIDVSTLDELDDERRLLYVAMTRAKKSLCMSSSATNALGKELAPSRLFEDIDDAYCVTCTTIAEEDAYNPVSSLAQSHPAPKIEIEFLKKVLSERGLSATALNNYLKSPWDYFYRNVLRVPEVQPLHMQFGTAMHNVMEKVTAFHTREQKLSTDTEIQKLLEQELSRLPISKEEYVRRHERGLEALHAYIQHTAPSYPKKTSEEFSVRVTMDTGIPEFPELILTGKLDRLDFDSDGNVVRVIDYKTGKPKTRNVIEGNTKTSDGGYKRQLTFYALLLELYGDERYACREGVLAFLEPDSKGVIHEEAYTITDDEIAALHTEIIAVVKEIISGKFLGEPCDPNVSDYCDLVTMLVGD
ncbi:MAG: DNA helicase-2/ATP-dependent DNA helicase PcrA [Candidatus Azotimanducaceae bacterium]|jgi:DNA helicase-2/ATP-dependent DNA helicase PcrA